MELTLREKAEMAFIKNLITNVYPTGLVSYVADTYDFFAVISRVVPKLKQEILARTPNALGMAKVVFRPDSGDPVDILCGTATPVNSLEEAAGIASKYFVCEGKYYINDSASLREVQATPEMKGAVECLWDIFGGTTTDKGFKVLHERVGLIYGDSITLDRANRIMERLMAKGFASCNCVFGIGRYTYQYNTRDTYGMAMKATWGVVNGEERELFKDPVTDNGTKKSARGLLRVEREGNDFKLYGQQTADQEAQGALETVFENSKLVMFQKWDEIRARLSTGG